MHSARQTKTLRPIFPTRLPLDGFLFTLLLLVLFFGSPYTAAAMQVRSSGGSAARPIPPSDSKLVEVKITGSKRFTSEEVAAASGLPLGTTVDDEAFRKAARQLGESGVFNDISYSYSYSSAGTKLVFKVTDADKFVPAHFLDFVWFTDMELTQKVHEHAPLFKGELPINGRLPDQVSDILQALLVENGIPGHVEYLRSPGPNGKLASVEYGVYNVVIRIHHVGFTGAGAGELPLLEAAAEKLSGRDYYRALLNGFDEHVVLPLYHERGYLKASCAPQQPKVVKDAAPETIQESADDKQAVTLLDVTIAITPGAQFKATGWNWSGNENVPTGDLQPLLHVKSGEGANTVQLEDDLRAVQQLYSSRGYVTATIKANAEFDEGASTVRYELVVTEGSVYHMGELEFRGIDNSLTAKLRAAWKIRPGDVYDATYLKEFLPQARRLLPPTIDWDVAPHVTAIAKDKTVDVDLEYTAKAPK
ncbi:MAG: POTRA domain-containing protein [Candidatus Sulfotelmatobacter sp.]|jgi:outer membrane protein insertion porin family